VRGARALALRGDCALFVCFLCAGHAARVYPLRGHLPRRLDLVLLSEEVSPPLGRLVEPGASPLAKRVRAKPASLQRLQQRRKSANAPSNKEMPVKELRLTRSIGDHDLAIKLRRAEEFLAKRHPVMVTMRTKGQLKDAAAELLVLEKFVGRLAAQGHIVAVKESDLAARVLPAPKSSSKAKAASGALRAAPASAPVASSEAAAATAGGPRSVSDADAVADVLRGTAAGNISGAP
jgi:translation initiation factor IF-3